MLSTFQNVFMRLLLDSAFRQQFVAAPGPTLAPCALTAEERHTLQAVAPGELERFARALMHKRWEQVQQVIPLSRRVCPSLRQRYLRWLARHPAPAAHTVLDPGSAEAWRALPFLHAAVRADAAEASYAADLLAFEVLRACTRQDGQPRTLRSAFAIHEIAHDVVRGCLPTEPEYMPSLYRFTQRGVQWKGQPSPSQPG